MMTFEEQAALVRCVKGAGSSILWILLLSDEALTAVELQEATGYSDKPVSQALARLKALGLVVHHGRAQGWRVSRRNWQEVTGSVASGMEQVPAERKEDSAAATEESSACPALTEHNVFIGAEGEDEVGPAAGGAAVENSASAVESSAVGEESSVRGSAACAMATVDSTAVTVRSSAVTVESSAATEDSTALGSALSGLVFGPVKQKSEVDWKISAFSPQKRYLSPEKIRIGRCGSGAGRSRGIAEGQARARVRNRSTTCYYCFTGVNSKQVKRQAKTRAGARPPPRGLGISETVVAWCKGGPRMSILKGRRSRGVNAWAGKIAANSAEPMPVVHG